MIFIFLWAEFLTALLRYTWHTVNYSWLSVSMGSTSTDSTNLKVFRKKNFLFQKVPKSKTYLIALASISCTMLSKSGESKHTCFFPDLRGKAFNLSPLSILYTYYIPLPLYIIKYYISCRFYQVEQVLFLLSWQLDPLKSYMVGFPAKHAWLSTSISMLLPESSPK